jgi:hypothetical protein
VIAKERQDGAPLSRDELLAELLTPWASEWARFDAMRKCGLDAYRQTFWPTAR